MIKQLLPHEYPRPDYRRNNFQLLNGTYTFAFDDQDVGLNQKWYKNPQFPLEIEVPFCYQSEKSSIGTVFYHPVLWYSRDFDVDEHLSGDHLLLHFGAVDYYTQVWVNGTYIGSHHGGYTPFNFEISNALVKDTQNILVLRVEDTFSCSQPRGKQYWKEYNEMCWYQACSGIWQSVWLEKVGSSWLSRVLCTPDIDTSTVSIEYKIEDASLQGKLGGNGKTNNLSKHEYNLSLHLTYENRTRASDSYSMDPSYNPESSNHTAVKTSMSVIGHQGKITLHIPAADNIKNTHWWSPQTPNLIGVSITLEQDSIFCDHIETYFGMRKIEIKGSEILLNHQPLEQILVLDQGYWPDTLLTPPSSEHLLRDIELAKSFGFNGARKHQKIEDPHFYYWADIKGFLVWGELPSSYEFTREAVTSSRRDMEEFILRDYNHPCIITWVPINESWGVRDIYSSATQQQFAASLYFTIKTADPTRLVISNDGWEMITQSDFYGIHDYTPVKEMLTESYFISQESLLQGSAQKKRCLAETVIPEQKPLLITEYGGIAFNDGSGSSWGYFGKVQNEEEFIARFENITKAFLDIPYVRGICYTQLTDVFQEKNGLLTMERVAKIAPDKIAAIINPTGIKDIKPNVII